MSNNYDAAAGPPLTIAPNRLNGSNTPGDVVAAAAIVFIDVIQTIIHAVDPSISRHQFYLVFSFRNIYIERVKGISHFHPLFLISSVMLFNNLYYPYHGHISPYTFSALNTYGFVG